MRPLLPFTTLTRRIRRVDRSETSYIEMSETDFVNMVRMFLSNAPFDNQWYCKTYPDVAKASPGDDTGSAQGHYIWHGYFEGRASHEFYFPEGDLDTFFQVPESLFEELRVASVALRSRHHSAAVAGFRRSLSLYPNSRIARRELGSLLLRRWHFLEAERVLLPLLESDPQDSLVRAQLAEIARQFRQHERAYSLLDPGSEHGPDILRLGKAWAACAIGRLSVCRKIANELSSVPDPETREFAVSAIQAYGAERIELAQRIRGGRGRKMTGEERVQIARHLARLGWTRTARGLIEQALRQGEPIERWADSCLSGLLDVCAVTDEEVGTKIVEDLRESDAPRSAALTLKLAGWLYGRDRLDEAIELLTALPDIWQAHPGGAELLALSFLRKQDFRSTERICRLAMHAWPHAFWPVEKLLHALFATDVLSWAEATPPDDRAGTEQRTSPLPRSVVQFWDKTDVPPDVNAAITSWRTSNPDLEHSLYSDESARAYIAAQYGGRHVAAFDLCYHPAMRSDLFRLAYLAEHGGVYADADETCLGSVTAFLSTYSPSNLYVVCSADSGVYFRNGFIACTPRHPVLHRALEGAVSTILDQKLRGGRPKIWEATGPGQITRALLESVLQTFDNPPLPAAKETGACLIAERDYGVLARSEWMEYKTRPEGNWRV
jgi:tetratricopeptide (TPR) repeat protein